MNRRKIFDQELFAYFITFSCYRRRRMLDHDQPKRLLLGMLGDQLRRQSATCVGIVEMPDQVHAIVCDCTPCMREVVVQVDEPTLSV